MTREVRVICCIALFAIVLAVASCGSSTTTSVSPSGTTSKTTSVVTSTKPSAELPKYGGEFIGSPSFESWRFDIVTDLFAGVTRNVTNERIIDGDWTKGPAGGYGTSDTLWDGSVNIPTCKEPRLAEEYTYSVNAETQSVTGIIKVRQGIHFALNSSSEASRLVNGREMTADDIVYNLNERMNNPNTMFYQTTPLCQGLKATKTGPWEVSFTIPVEDAVSNLMKLIDNTLIVPKEVMDKYGDMSDWKNSVGTGPFMLTDFVSNSSATLKKNPNYWMKDPIGPGKGNKLPYLDSVKWLVITDKSTRLSAIRTAKIYVMDGLVKEDLQQLKGATDLKKANLQPTGVGVLGMRTDKEPFNDVKVRQALFLAINWEDMNKNLYDGEAQIITYPYWYVKGYEGIYMDYNAPDIPADVKEIFSYNPDKAKQLLTEAGYPEGFKTTLLLSPAEADVDYYSIIKEFWSKINVDLTLSTMEGGALFSLIMTKNYDQMILNGQSPPSTYPEQYSFTGNSWVNMSCVKDDWVTGEVEKARYAYVTGDIDGAIKMTRELLPYVIKQCWVIGPLRYPSYVVWWPWVKNYSGEVSVGYVSNNDFTRWIWLDQDLKESLGR